MEKKGSRGQTASGLAENMRDDHLEHYTTSPGPVSPLIVIAHTHIKVRVLSAENGLQQRDIFIMRSAQRRAGHGSPFPIRPLSPLSRHFGRRPGTRPFSGGTPTSQKKWAVNEITAKHIAVSTAPPRVSDRRRDTVERGRYARPSYF